ncbi:MULTISPECIES: MFS transporter [unclassified Brenneria]|uniref:MFS transporter n=1 Tax=unclassified Brenneria TaxID=2634434 RepID=UPI0015538D82|nr:MFS transporter [Brenneria sp. hezel4-2-4]MEE3650368.1 MFS transporter [Brenneria sp. HEZEL_4_2_4]NPD00324.1 MFS transporter [Brenneria sp. hezel4-2-4]
MSAAISAPAPAVSPAQPVFGIRLTVGLLGVLLAAMMAGLSSRVPALVLVDIQGGLGFAKDDISWLSTAYSAGELAAMPFAAWFAITFSMRRFHLTMLAAALALAAVLPFIRDLHVLLALRVLHGLCAGSLVPILMMAALRFLPAPIRLHGLALFAMTATLSPNVALWLAALSVDHLENWRWAYWHVIPLGLLAMAMVGWGIPKMPTALPRLKQANWFGMMFAIPGLMLLVVGIDQGVRLDWLHSPVIVAALGVGVSFTALFLVSEWFHAAPFVRLDLLKRRNIWLGFISLTGLLVAMFAGVGLPANALATLHGFRLQQSAPLGLMVGLPQLVLGSCVAMLLYRRWVDARHVFAAGLACMAAACWLASGITDEWMVRQFLTATLLHAIGQPLAMVAMLFLIVSVVQPMEGPFLAGLVNIVRVISTILAGAFTGQLNVERSRFHYETLRDRAGNLMPHWAGFDTTPAELAEQIARQSSVLAVADVYRAIGLMVLLLIPLVLKFQHIPAPVVPRIVPSVPSAAQTDAAAKIS